MMIEYNVDIWLLFGSFAYALESKVFSWSETELTLAVQTKNKDEIDGIEDFLSAIMKKPKGLLRVELRVYGPPRELTRYGIKTPLYMYTEMIPKSYPRSAHSPLIGFSNVKGISPSDEQQWFKLVRQIWSQTFSH
ncbi:MAG: hypothetical protein K2X39_08190 [Silvanigrellaceae bacterium]|nr:hypothetical protein [Silvanigrellaceae bacterium]